MQRPEHEVKSLKLANGERPSLPAKCHPTLAIRTPVTRSEELTAKEVEFRAVKEAQLEGKTLGTPPPGAPPLA